MESCEKCNDGWVVTDGEVDDADGLLLIIPTEYHACSCSPYWAGVGEEVAVIC